MIIPKYTPLGELYKSNAVLSVPKYQRSFDWGKSEVFEMMTDLKSSMDTDKQMFLGTFVFDISQKHDYKIVDGQQRITSFTLLLIACRQLAKKLKYHSLAQEIQKKISFTDETTGDMISERVLVSSSISDVFKFISDESWDGEFPTKIGSKQVKRQSTKIKGLYDFMYEEINHFGKSDLTAFLKAIYSTYVIEIDIQDELEAFDIFERTNARGMSLNVADLLKNYLYANAGEEEYVEEKWKLITENAGNTLQRMLKYFWVARHGAVSKTELYRRLKSYGNSEGAKDLTDGICDFSIYYSAIQSDDEKIVKEWLAKEGCDSICGNKGYLESIVSSVSGLNHFKITQHFPLIYSITSAYKKTDKSEKETKLYLKLIEDIEKYHFINNQICARVGNEIEKPYAEYSQKFFETNDFFELGREFVSLLKSKLATEEEFISRFTELDYEELTLADSCYIFNKINNYDLKPSEWVNIYNPDKTILQNHYNTEHFLSQNPSKQVSAEDMDVVDNIGNLFVISRHTNSRLQNVAPKEKIEMLKDRGKKFRYVMSFVEQFEKGNMKWGKQEILSRANELAKLAYREAWKIK